MQRMTCSACPACRPCRQGLTWAALAQVAFELFAMHWCAARQSLARELWHLRVHGSDDIGMPTPHNGS